MKTPKEIKKGLAMCSTTEGSDHCAKCPYRSHDRGDLCIPAVTGDALARIQQLEYALCLMISQYCWEDDYVTHRHMMAGEHAFAALGIEDYSSIETVEEMLDGMEGPT